MTFVVINNDGGGIFHRLPVADFEPTFTDLFLTPHGLSFEHAAAMYGLDYTLLEKEGLNSRRNYTNQLSSQKSSIIEVLSDSAAYEKQRRAYLAAVEKRLQLPQTSL